MDYTNVVVFGSRDFNDFDFMCQVLDEELRGIENPRIISGAARGADLLGERYARFHNIPILRFPADWSRYGRSAGFIRNGQMAAIADKGIAFWDGSSRGTRNMIEQLRIKGIEPSVHNYLTESLHQPYQFEQFVQDVKKFPFSPKRFKELLLEWCKMAGVEPTGELVDRFFSEIEH